MEPVTLAAAAVPVVGKYLLELAGKSAEEGAKEGGKAVFGWIKGKLTSASGQEAVEKFEKAPEARGPRMALEGQLLTLLEENPAAAAELAKLLPAEAVRQTLNIVGDNNTAINASGSSVSINR